jgi:hypothetical protein
MTTGQRPEDVHRTIEIASRAHRLGNALKQLRADLAEWDETGEAAPFAHGGALAESARELFAALDEDLHL